VGPEQTSTRAGTDGVAFGGDRGGCEPQGDRREYIGHRNATGRACCQWYFRSERLLCYAQYEEAFDVSGVSVMF